VFPVVSFKNLRDLAIPEGITFLRRGVDYFAVIFEPNVETEKAIAFLKQTDVFCLKPDENTRDRRADGYYYDQEYVLPKEQWYLATSQHLPKD
jgi:hypothetical protein